jgi:hypothetical protein
MKRLVGAKECRDVDWRMSSKVQRGGRSKKIDHYNGKPKTGGIRPLLQMNVSTTVQSDSVAG